MKKCSLLFFFILLALKSAAQEPLRDDLSLFLADPTIFLHNGVYYLYGTTAGSREATGEGFRVYTSTDLINWEGPKGAREGYALKKEDVYGTEGFWAPQVFQYAGKFYMAYTANENISIAQSDSPLGPFKNSGTKIESPVRQIDPYVFFDDDGKKYLYHVRLQEGNRIFVAELNDDLSAIKEGTLVQAIVAEEKWEDTRGAKWPVAEGPTVIKQDGLYYLFYSANDFRNPDYAVGVAVSTGPLGPWRKSGKNPLIDKGIGANGTGHGDILETSSGELFYVLHTHNSETAVRPRRVGIVKMKLPKNTAEEPRVTVDQQSFKYLRKE